MTIVNLGLTRARLAAYLARDKAMDDNKIMGLVMRRSIEIVDELEPDFERNEPLIEEFCNGVPK